MNIIVCLKPVPDPGHWDKIALDPKTRTLRREGIPSVLGPLDKRALEAALQLKEARGGRISVVSMAPPSAADTLREALAMGADAAALLSDIAFTGADTLATAYVLACGIRKLGEFDLVLCGNRSLDGSTGHVALQLAEILGVPGIVRAISLEMSGERKLRARTKQEGGTALLEARLPAVVAVEKEINEPRFVTLMGIVEARGREVKVWKAADLGADCACCGTAGSPTCTAGGFMPEQKRRREMLTGEPSEVARALVERLKALGAFSEAGRG